MDRVSLFQVEAGVAPSDIYTTDKTIFVLLKTPKSYVRQLKKITFLRTCFVSFILAMGKTTDFTFLFTFEISSVR